MGGGDGLGAGESEGLRVEVTGTRGGEPLVVSHRWVLSTSDGDGSGIVGMGDMGVPGELAESLERLAALAEQTRGRQERQWVREGLVRGAVALLEAVGAGVVAVVDERVGTFVSGRSELVGRAVRGLEEAMAGREGVLAAEVVALLHRMRERSPGMSAWLAAEFGVRGAG